MKTKVMSVVCVLALLLTLTACGGSDSQPQKSAAEIADAIYSTQTFQDTLNAIDSDMLGDYYRIDAADLTDSKVYVSGSFSTAEEIAVFQASSSDAVENIKKAIDTRLEDLKLAFENYVPGEMTKINSSASVEYEGRSFAKSMVERIAVG